MPEFPGQLTDEEQRAWILRFRDLAEKQFGAARLAEMEDSLRSTALAVGSLLKLEFVRDEAPGFYLAPRFDEATGEWRVG